MDKQPTLYIVATPIGNLKDVTFRAIETLKGADIILCEDTRVTKRLLDHYHIIKPMLSYHQRSKLSRTEKIIEHLESGKQLALVTDAGTPGISDPGNELICALLAHFGDALHVVPIPGPSAMTALIQAAGINLSKFVFLGFPPNKKGRETFFKKVIAACYPIIYYDSPHRFMKNLTLLAQLSTSPPSVIVGRELTKVFEEIRRGTTDEVLEYYGNHPEKLKGEFAVIVSGKDPC